MKLAGLVLCLAAALVCGASPATPSLVSTPLQQACRSYATQWMSTASRTYNVNGDLISETGSAGGTSTTTNNASGATSQLCK